MTATRATRRPAAARGGGDGSGDGYRPDIEGLRAVAVLLVLLFHASLGPFNGGFVGVDVFYVLSGFLITGLLLREIESTGHISLPTFYARRARRLLPAAMLVLVVTLVASVVLLPPLLVPTVASDTVAAALYVSNIGFAMRATDYFAAGQAPSPVLHYWSLGVEEQFYLLWPAILLIVAAHARRPRRRAGLAVLAIAAGSFVFSLWLTSTNAAWAFFTLPTRAWELGLGAILAVAGTRLRYFPRRGAGLAGWLGLGLIVLAAVAFSDATPFPGSAALVPTIGAALVVFGGSHPARPGPARLLSLGLPRFFGRISYSLYLWHWPLLVLPAAALGGALATPQRIGLALAAIVLATLTHRWIEDPIRRGRLVGVRPGRNLAMAGALTVAVAVAANGIGLSTASALSREETAATGPQTDAQNEQALQSILNALESASSPPGASPLDTASPTGKLAAPGTPSPTQRPAPVRPPTADRPVPAGLDPSLAAAANDYPQSYVDGCHTQSDGSHAGFSNCLYGDLASKTTIALFGDSHALSWFPAVGRVAEQRGWRLLDLTMSTCNPADLALWDSNIQRVSTECSRWRQQAIARLVNERPAIVLVTGTRGIQPVDAAGHALTGPAMADAWAAGFKRTLARLVAAAGRVIVIADTPLSRVDPAVCLSAHLDSILACATPVSKAIDAAWLAHERQVALESGAGFIDPEYWVCPTSPCPPVIGNVLVLRDAGHMSTVFAAALASRLDARIETELQPGPRSGVVRTIS